MKQFENKYNCCVIAVAVMFAMANMLTPIFETVEYRALPIVLFFTGFISFIAGTYILNGAREFYKQTLSDNKLQSKFSDKSFFTIFAMGILYLLIYFPGVGMYDSVGIVLYGINAASQHPWLYCLIIETIRDFALQLFNNYEAVFVIESMIQILVASFISAHCLYWLKKKELNKYILYFIFCIFAFFPIIDLQMVTLFKDIPFSYMFLEWFMLLYDACYEPSKTWNKRNQIRVVILTVLSLIRNNGIYVVAFILLCLFFTFKQYRKLFIRFSLVLIAAIGISSLYQTKNNITHLFKETVGIPLQQIGAVVCDENGKLSEEQKEFIDQILPLEYIKEHYNPYTSDNLKWGGSPLNNSFLNSNKYQFIKEWFLIGLRNPGIYVNEYLRATYGFWCTSDNANGRYSSIYVEAFKDFFDWSGIRIKTILSPKVQNVLEEITWSSTEYFWSEGHLFWIFLLLLLVLIKQTEFKYAICAAPCIGGWLTIMASTPVAYQWRYTYYLALTIPLLAGTICLNREMKLGKKKQ